MIAPSSFARQKKGGRHNNDLKIEIVGWQVKDKVQRSAKSKKLLVDACCGDLQTQPHKLYFITHWQLLYICEG